MALLYTLLTTSAGDDPGAGAGTLLGVGGTLLGVVLGAIGLQVRAALDRRAKAREAHEQTTVVQARGAATDEAALRAANVQADADLRGAMMDLIAPMRAELDDQRDQLKQERAARREETLARQAESAAHAAEIADTKNKLITLHQQVLESRTQIGRLTALFSAIDTAGRQINADVWRAILLAATGTTGLTLPPLPDPDADGAPLETIS